MNPSDMKLETQSTDEEASLTTAGVLLSDRVAAAARAAQFDCTGTVRGWHQGGMAVSDRLEIEELTVVNVRARCRGRCLSGQLLWLILGHLLGHLVRKTLRTTPGV